MLGYAKPFVEPKPPENKMEPGPPSPGSPCGADLQRYMEKNDLSKNKTAKVFGCSPASLYRFLDNPVTPLSGVVLKGFLRAHGKDE